MKNRRSRSILFGRRGALLFGVTLEADFVASLQLDRWSLLSCDGQSGRFVRCR
jgi:hypothetical protein